MLKFRYELRTKFSDGEHFAKAEKRTDNQEMTQKQLWRAGKSVTRRQRGMQACQMAELKKGKPSFRYSNKGMETKFSDERASISKESKKTKRMDGRKASKGEKYGS